jgi:FkbM family methyltransferase
MNKTKIDAERIRIDVGLSWNAPYSKRWLTRDPGIYIFAFEPNLDNVNTIIGKHPPPGIPEFRLELIGDIPTANSNTVIVHPQIMIFPIALGKENMDNVAFHYMTGDSGTSSLYYPIKHNLGRIENTKIRRLDVILDQFELTKTARIELLKVDTQGNDYDVLVGAGEWLKKIELVQFEMPSDEYVDQHDYFPEANKLLLNYGFQLAARNKSDALFINCNIKTSAIDKFILADTFLNR